MRSSRFGIALGCLLWAASAAAQSVPMAVPAAQQWQVASPSGKLVASIRQSADGGAEYAVALDGRRVIEWSPLGLTLAWVDQSKAEALQRADFARTVTFGRETRRGVRDAYAMVTGKRRDNAYAANALTLALTDAETGRRLDLEFQLADDGAAFRYVLPESSAVHHWVEAEDTGFALATGGRSMTRPTPGSRPMKRLIRAGCRSAPLPRQRKGRAGAFRRCSATKAGHGYCCTRLG